MGKWRDWATFKEKTKLLKDTKSGKGQRELPSKTPQENHVLLRFRKSYNGQKGVENRNGLVKEIKIRGEE